ncbi:MAG: tetratricopeptide repeat protein [Deferribacterales bacterium]|jgi:tetratricopeptide (TPR) repeat protein
MYTLLISVAISTAAALGLYFLTYQIFWPLFIMVVGILGLNFYIGRKVVKKLEGLFRSIEKDIQGGRVEKAVEKLKSGYTYAKWQFMVKEQIDSQIGILYYTAKDFDKAEPYLENAFSKNWMAMSMRAAAHYKKGDMDKVKKVMDKGIKGAPKETFMYALYAWFLMEKGEKEKAMEVLTKGVEKNPIDERLSSNLDAVKNGKKLKMQNYGNYWLQMHLGGKNPQGGQQYQQFLMNQRMKRR